MAIRDAWMGKNRLWGMVLLGLITAAICLSAETAPARAATATVVTSADPTEDKPVTVTVSGQAEANRKLWVVAFHNINETCGYQNAYSLLYSSSSGTNVILSQSLATGSYEVSADFVPPEPGGYVLCAFVAQDLNAIPVVKTRQGFQVRKPKVTATVTISADPTEEKPVMVTVKGQSEVNRGLWVVASPLGSAGCSGNTPYDLMYGSSGSKTLLNNVPILAGEYEKTAAFTPPDTGSYRVCAFVAEGSQGEANVKASREFSARAPKIRATIGVSSDPTEEKPVTVTVTGDTEVNRSLWVSALPAGSTGCSANSAYQMMYSSEGKTLLNNTSVSAGVFERTANFVPPASGKYLICAFFAEDSQATPNARVSSEVTIRGKRALLSLMPEGTFQHLVKSTFRIGVLSEAAGDVTVFLQEGPSPCPARAGMRSDGTVGESVEGFPVQPGQFEIDGWFIPRSAGTNRICAYLTDAKGVAVGTASAEVIVERNPAFLPKLITPGGKRSRVRPPALIWKTGPGNDRIELFRKKPRKGSRPINVRRGVISFIGGESVGRWKATFSWRYRYGTGRYWWRIVRTDSVSGYTETSAPRTFVIMGPRR